MSPIRRVEQLALLALLATNTLTAVQGQALQFTNVPETVTEGTEDLIISWTGGDGVTPVQVTLVQDNRLIDTLDDDDDSAGQSVGWDIELEDSPGGYYSLRLVQGTQTVDSNPINIIDELGRAATGPPPGGASPPSTSGSAPASAPATTTAQPTDAAGGLPSASNSNGATATATTLLTTTTPLNTLPASGSASQTVITVSPSASSTSGNSTATGNQSDSSESNGLSGGAIAGIVLGILVLLSILGFLAWWYYRRRAKRLRHEPRLATSSFENSGDGENGAAELHSEKKHAELVGSGGHGVHGQTAELYSPDTTTYQQVDSDPGNRRTYELASPDTVSAVENSNVGRSEVSPESAGPATALSGSTVTDEHGRRLRYELE